MKLQTKSTPLLIISILTVFSFTNCSDSIKLKDGGLRIGWAMEDITPDGPVSLSGQYYERISTFVQIPDFDIRKLFLNATHTHSAPNPDSKTDQKYKQLLSDKLSKLVLPVIYPLVICLVVIKLVNPTCGNMFDEPII